MSSSGNIAGGLRTVNVAERNCIASAPETVTAVGAEETSGVCGESARQIQKKAATRKLVLPILLQGHHCLTLESEGMKLPPCGVYNGPLTDVERRFLVDSVLIHLVENNGPVAVVWKYIETVYPALVSAGTNKTRMPVRVMTVEANETYTRTVCGDGGSSGPGYYQIVKAGYCFAPCEL